MKKNILFIVFPLLLFPLCAMSQAMDKEKCFEYVFGDKVRLDAAMVKKVGSDLSGKRYYVDKDKDGKPEEVWYVDVDPRHSDSKRPILVRAIDCDNDMQMGGEPDMDSDLYVVDYNADGLVDAVVHYEDIDGDQDVDRMCIFFFDPGYGLRAWWSSDDGDDNMLWYTINYAYYQKDCEQKTNFGGDETFDALYIKPGDKQWNTISENPFCFFDRDGDGLTEEVIRLVGIGQSVHSLRWSFDVDNDATKENPRDYDVSLSAIVGNGQAGPDNEGSKQAISYGDDLCNTLMIEGFPAKIMKRGAMVPFLSRQIWSREMMTWDENDLNIVPYDPNYTIERWEGVLAAESKEKGYEMPKVGGPDSGPFNKRFEVVIHPREANTFYYSAGDQRIHIKGSDKTWLKVDYDYDKKMDMKYEWVDANKDGVVDKVLLDVDGDGKWDDSWTLNVTNNKIVEWAFQNLNSAYSGVIAEEPERLYRLNVMLSLALESKVKGAGSDAVWNMINQKLRCPSISNDLSDRLIKSNESMLYYLRIAADRRIVSLKRRYGNKAFWKHFDMLRGEGNTTGLTDLLAKQFKLSLPPEDAYGAWISALRSIGSTKRVCWNNTWYAPNWGWESDKAAYRCYDGHFDLFGKRQEGFILPLLKGDTYHTDKNTWGMDILHVGQTGGCGGLVLYVNGIAYPLRHEKEGDPVYKAHLVQESNDSVTIGWTVTDAGPKDYPYTVYVNCTAIGGHWEDMRNVKIEGGKPGDNIQLGIVLTKIPVEDFFLERNAGVMGLWGYQDPSMGWVGEGVMFAPERYVCQRDTPEEYRAVLKVQRGEWLRFYAQGDWLRGHRFGPGAGSKDWKATLLEEAWSLNRK